MIPILCIAMSIVALVFSNRLVKAEKEAHGKVSALARSTQIVPILALLGTSTLVFLALPVAMGW
mgnify:CR=1 FL=1